MGLMQNPLSKMGSVFANDLVLALALALWPKAPVSISTFAGSVMGAAWRILITPIDTCKTIAQTDGPSGAVLLREKIGKGGLCMLWSGWEGNYVASLVSNYPWFATLNLLQETLPAAQGSFMKLARNGFIGAVASSVSDLVSNCFRVVKTMKQTHPNVDIGYTGAVQEVIQKDGVHGLCCRGLVTRVLTNVLQGAFFTVLWEYFSG